MRTTKNKPHPQGFIRGRGFLTLLGIAALLAITYFGTTWGREYYVLKMGETCSERMWIIEGAKKKYREKTGKTNGTISMYSELLPFLPFTGFPMCPWGGEYADKLSLDNQVSCPCNGKPEYEPKQTGKKSKLMKNGYNDLGKKPKAVTLFEFFNDKAKWQKMQKEEEKEKSGGKGIFAN